MKFGGLKFSMKTLLQRCKALLFLSPELSEFVFIPNLIPTNVCAKAVHKKSLFPVLRMAVIVASRVAAIFFFSLFFWLGKCCPFLEKTI